MKFLQGFCFFILAFFLINGFFKINPEKEKNKDCHVLQVDQYFDGLQFHTQGPFQIKIVGQNIASVESLPQPFTETECSFQVFDQTLAIPGLIDTHTHVFAFDQMTMKGWLKALTWSALSSEEKRLQMAKVNLLSLLQNGFTTVRDLGNSGQFLEKKLNLSSDFNIYPTLIYSGPGWSESPSQIPKNPYQEYQIVDINTDINTLLDQYVLQKASWIKIYLDQSISRKTMSADLAQKIVEKSREKGLKVAAHAEYKESLELALKIQVDSIEHAYETTTVKYKSTRAFVVPTRLASTACQHLENIHFRMPGCNEQNHLEKHRIDWLKTNHIPWAFGSDAVLDFSSQYKSRGEATLENLISYQSLYSASEVLSRATYWAGQLLQLPIGQIKTNYNADLVLYSLPTKTDQLDFLRTPQVLYKNGVQIPISRTLLNATR